MSDKDGIQFIYRELDIAKQFPGDGGYQGGIKARALDSMDCISRFFASIFCQTIEYKGKTYLVGKESFKQFAIRNSCSDETQFDSSQAAKNILDQYVKLEEDTRKEMKQKAETPPKINFHEKEIEVSGEDLEKVFNAIGVAAADRDRLFLKFDKTPAGYIISKDNFLKALDKPLKKPSEELPVELKKMGQQILQVLDQKTTKDDVQNKLDQLFFDTHQSSIDKPTDKPPSPTQTPFPNIDEKELAHIQGSTFAQNTGYEGSSAILTISSLLNVMQAKKYFSNQSEITSLLKEGLQIGTSIPSPSSDQKMYHQNIANYSQELSKKVKSLRPGEKVMIPGGWSHIAEGHALIYLIEKARDGTFAITVINTGSGIEYHDAYQLNLKQKSNAIYRLKDIDEEKICNPLFFASLVELRSTLKKDNSPWEHGPKDIYERILPNLEGKRDYSYENNRDFISEQKAGTCSWQSLIKLVRLETGDSKEYKNFIFDVKKLSLLAFHEKYHTQQNLKDETVRLFDRSKESFLQYALQLYKDKIITQKELESAKAVCKLHLSSATSESSPLTFDSLHLFPEEPIPQEYFTPFDPVTSKNIVLENSFSAPIVFTTPPKDLSELNQRLTQVIEQSKKYQKTREGRPILNDIIASIHSLQTVSIETLSQGRPAEEIESAMGNFLQVYHLAMSAISMLPESERGFPDQAALLTILFGFNKRLFLSVDTSHNPLNQTKWNFKERSDFLGFEVSQYAIIHDPVLRTLFAENKSHLTIMSDSKGLFSPGSPYQEVTLSFHQGKCTSEPFRSLLASPQFLSRVHERFPDLIGKSDEATLKQVLPFLTDLKDNLFPKAYQILFIQNCFDSFYRYNPHLNKWDGQSSIENQSSSPYHSSGWRPTLMPSLQGIKDSTSYEITNDELLGTRFKSCYPSFETKSFDTIFEKVNEYHTTNHWMNKVHNCRWSEMSNTACFMPAAAGLSTRETHEIAYIASNKEMLVPNLISYFHRYPDLFMKRDSQLAFYHLLFAGSVLDTTVKTNPQLNETLHLFLRSNVELQRGLGNTQGVIFLLSLIEELEIHCPSAQEKINFQSEFTKIASSIPDTLILGKRLKALAFAHFLSSYSDKTQFTDEELVKLCSAYSYVKAFGYDKNLLPGYLLEKMQRTMHTVSHALSIAPQAIQKAVVEKIGETVLKNQAMKWNGSYPHFTTEDQSFRIDLSTLSIFEGANLIGALPSKIIDDPHFQTLFSKKQITATLESPGVYVFSLEKAKETYRLFHQGDQLIIQKEINDKWHTYFPPDSVKQLLKPSCLIDNHICWVLGDNTSSSMVIESLETERPIARVIIKKNPAAPEWYKINPGKDDDGALLQDIYTQDTPFSHFFHFQPKESVLLWGNKTVEFPSFNIQFTQDTEGKMCYSKDSSYHLSKDQTAPKTTPLFKACITLENNKGNKKYLFSREPIMSESRGSLGRKTKIEFNNKEARFFEIEEKNGRLVGKTVEENLYLVHLHMANKNYKEAHALLKQTLVGNPRGYTDSEKELIEWIETQWEASGDTSPEAYSTLLQVTYFKIRNTPDIETIKDLSDKLTRYYSVKRHAKTAALKPEQELELLSFVKKQGMLSPLLDYRWHQLTENKQAIPDLFTVTKGKLVEEISLPTFKPDDAAAIITSKKDQDSPLLLLEGDDYLSCHFEQFFTGITSENSKERELAAFELGLLNNEDLGNIRDAMRFFAKKSTAEMRQSLRESISPATPLNKQLALFLKVSRTIPGIVEKPPITEEVQPKIAPKPQKKDIIPKKLDFMVDTNPSEALLVESMEKSLSLVSETVKPSGPNPLLPAFTPKPTDSKILQTECTRLQKSIQANDDTPTAHYLLDDQTLEKIALTAGHTIDNLTEANKKIEALLLSTANRRPIDQEEALRFEIELEGKARKELSLDDLIILYLQGNGKGLSKRNPHLQQSDVDLLSKNLKTYLVQKTEIDYQTRVQQLALDAKKAAFKDPILSDLDSALKQQRTYDPKEKILLIYEYYSGFRLRPEQTTLISEMATADTRKRQNLITQLLMGSGKSKVILPLLAYLLSDGESAPALVVPSRLYHQNIEDMRSTSGMLGQPVETITLEPGKPLSIEKMEEILKTIERVKEERSYLLLEDQTIHDLFLHFKETLREIGEVKNPPPDLMERFGLIKKIINNFSTVIIDEVDLVLDCSREVNVSCGQKELVQEETKKNLATLFRAINSDPVLNTFFKLDCETETLFNPKEYETTIKPLLIKTILTLTALSGQELAEAEKYLRCDPSLLEVPSFIKDNKELRNLLSLSKELVNKLFPLVLDNKNSDEHFGLSKINSLFSVIPYIRSNTAAEGSEFGTVFETMLYTMLYYTRKGISPKNIRDLVDNCKSEALQEFKAFQTPLEQTKGYLRFQKLGLGSDLFHIQEDDIQQGIEAFNKDINKKIEFAQEFGWDELGNFPLRLSSNSMSLVELFEWVQGFAGTLGNSDTFHKDLQAKPDLATDGKTLNILKKSNAQVLPLPANVTSLLQSLDGYHALIDEGAWLRGLDGLDVAKKILELYPSFKGIVYVNDKDIPKGSLGRSVILERKNAGESPEVKLLTESNIPPEERFTYYNITEGVDIKQAPLAKALTTVSKTTTLRGMLQAVWRMRGLENKQKVDFALPKELEEDIGGATLEQMFLHCTKNQAKKQEEDNLRSVKQKITHEIEAMIMKVVLDPDAEESDVIHLCQKAKGVISRTSSLDPWELFGQLEFEKEMDKVIENYIKIVLDEFKPIYDATPSLQKIMSWTALEKTLEGHVNYDLLPKKDFVSGTQGYGVRTAVKTQVKVEQKIQVKTKLQVNTLTEVRPEWWQIAPDRHWIGNIFSAQFWKSDKGPESKTVNQELMKNEKTVGPLPKFSDRLKMSSNYANALKDDYGSEQIIFQNGTKPVGTAVLLIGDDGELQLQFLSPTEGELLSKLLDLDKKYDSTKNLPISPSDSLSKVNRALVFEGKRDLNIALITPECGIVKTGKKAVDKKILESPQYTELVSQAKFYNGVYNDFTPKEQQYLKSWIKEQGTDQMITLFSHILRARPEDVKAFEGSILEKIFNEA